MGVLTLPIRGLLWIFEEIADQAERALYGEEEVRAALRRLYEEWERGSVNEEEFARRESELVLRLEEGRRRRHGTAR